ncbi:LysR family transcriptional regulator [Gluconacetobacter sp. 1b LMG 1731]|uniref:LysR family transcriptional regulator n=1 Tax=Gluconacetobacter dulcium TaxID=2729096 RepID=A0A7W4IMW3_9PROT|nr:LysR family transcriptional regulator [Gluconacetobacter dulcium]MBB2165757.1 LysR family transcriptional regulator [Gluconacetobacter dulcium]MBB2194818.1 LysR family transcriptional regulator [Gluconacetobacter dulcium]
MSTDLNLLHVFDMLMIERHVGRAARRLNRSQPAVSQALARLRDCFGDPLFVRGAGVLVPTPRAQQIWADCHEPLRYLQEVFAPPPFEPSRTRLRMTFGAAEDVEQLLLPGIVDVISSQVAEAHFEIQPTDWQSVNDDLLRGKFDMAFTISGDSPPEIQREILMKTGFSCMYDPSMMTPPSVILPWYLDIEHVIVAFSDNRPSFISDYFKMINRVRRCLVSTRSILSTADYVRGTRAVATLPSPIASLLARRHGLATFPLPFDAISIDYSMLWSRKRGHDPVMFWLAAQIRGWAKAQTGSDISPV